MKTYVANCTQQNQQINVRLPDSRKPIALTIPMGRQLLIGDLSAPELAALEDQLGPYGLIAVDDIKRSTKKITYVFSTGSPVPADSIRLAHDRNRGILRDEGKQRRIESAVAANAGMNTDETPLNKLEVSIEEESSGTIPSEDPIAEGVKIDNQASTNENKPRRAPRSGGNRG